MLAIDEHELLIPDGAADQSTQADGAAGASSGGAGAGGTHPTGGAAGIDSSLGGVAGATAGSGGTDAGADADAAPDVITDGTTCPSDGSLPVLEGGLAPTAFVTDAIRPTQIAFNQTNVYYIEAALGTTTGSVKRSLVNGVNSGTTTIASGLSNPQMVRVTNEAVYIVNDFDDGGGGKPGIYKLAEDSGTLELVYTDAYHFSGLGLDVFNSVDFGYTEIWGPGLKAGIRSTKLDGSATGSCFPYRSAYNGGRIAGFWLDQPPNMVYVIDTLADAIMRTPSDNCSGTLTVPFAEKMGSAKAILGDATHVYWITADTIYRLDKNKPNGPPEVLLCGRSGLNQIDSQGGLIAIGDAGAGEVLLFTKSTGEFSTIASGLTDVSGVRVLGNGTVIWSENATGKLWRYPGL